MRPTFFLFAATTSLLNLASAGADAQNPQHEAVYRAIRATPAGALAPVLTSTLGGYAQGSAQLALRASYSPGLHDQSVANNYAATGIFPIGLGGTLSFTAGVRAPTCGGCDRSLMIGAGADRRLVSFGVGETMFPLRFTVNVQGELGHARPENGTAFSGYFGIPIATVIGGGDSDVIAGRGYRFSAFATPGIAWAQELSDPSVSATAITGSRFMLGAGVGVFHPAANLMVNVGVQQIAIELGEPQMGIVVTIGGR